MLRSRAIGCCQEIVSSLVVRSGEVRQKLNGKSATILGRTFEVSIDLSERKPLCSASAMAIRGHYLSVVQ
jgi:hypothetical protein